MDAIGWSNCSQACAAQSPRSRARSAGTLAHGGCPAQHRQQGRSRDAAHAHRKPLACMRAPAAGTHCLATRLHSTHAPSLPLRRRGAANVHPLLTLPCVSAHDSPLVCCVFRSGAPPAASPPFLLIFIADLVGCRRGLRRSPSAAGPLTPLGSPASASGGGAATVLGPACSSNGDGGGRCDDSMRLISGSGTDCAAAEASGPAGAVAAAATAGAAAAASAIVCRRRLSRLAGRPVAPSSPAAGVREPKLEACLSCLEPCSLEPRCRGPCPRPRTLERRSRTAGEQLRPSSSGV